MSCEEKDDERDEESDDYYMDPMAFCQPEMASSADEDTDLHQLQQPPKLLTPSVSITPVSLVSKSPKNYFVPKILHSNGTSTLTLTKVSLLKRTKSEDGVDDNDWQHPLELKKLILGSLRSEMTVQVRRSSKSKFTNLTRKCFYDEQHQFELEPGRILGPSWQHGDDPMPLVFPRIVSCKSIDADSANASHDDEDEDDFNMRLDDDNGKVKDPETGTTRYKCRYESKIMSLFSIRFL
jgi:hypothetical protein